MMTKISKEEHQAFHKRSSALLTKQPMKLIAPPPSKKREEKAFNSLVGTILDVILMNPSFIRMLFHRWLCQASKN